MLNILEWLFSKFVDLLGFLNTVYIVNFNGVSISVLTFFVSVAIMTFMIKLFMPRT